MFVCKLTTFSDVLEVLFPSNVKKDVANDSVVNHAIVADGVTVSVVLFVVCISVVVPTIFEAVEVTPVVSVCWISLRLHPNL